MKTTGTVIYQRQHKGGLTMPQLNAIDLLAGGKTDKQTAELLNLSRTCITKWWLYDPIFQAALNRRRAEVWSAGIDRLRSLIPVALDALAVELENPDSPHRRKAATEILRLVQLPGGSAGIGPTDPGATVAAIVSKRRASAPARWTTCSTTTRGYRPSSNIPKKCGGSWKRGRTNPTSRHFPSRGAPGPAGDFCGAGWSVGGVR